MRNMKHETRRAFLRQLAVQGSAAASVGKLWADEAPQRSNSQGPPVVDTHMHVWADDSQQFPFRHPYQKDFVRPQYRGTVEMLIDDMDRNGVTHCVLVQVIYHGWDNRYLVHCMEKYPGRFASHGLIDPTDASVALKLEYWVAEMGLSGMRFSPIYYPGKDEWIDARSTDALWDKAAELGARFNYFIAPDQLPKLGKMIERHPEVPVIVDHLSQMDLAIEDPQPALNKLLALARHENVWVKVSELASVSKSGKYPYEDAYPWVRQVYEAFGPDRLLWGTGYPGSARANFNRPTLAQEIDLIRNGFPFFTDADQNKILGGNAAKLWNL